jgi:hypothetical protein
MLNKAALRSSLPAQIGGFFRPRGRKGRDLGAARGWMQLMAFLVVLCILENVKELRISGR